MEPPAQISCSGNCLVHLHSASGKAWLQRHYCPFQRHVGPDGISRFWVSIGNNEATYLSAHEILTSHFQSQIATFERLHGQRVQNIVVLIPASSKPRRYQSRLSAIAAAAGVRIVHSIQRSVLAASAYRSLSTTGRRTVLVFELGGQFLEISLLTEDQDRGLNIMAAVSDMYCPLFNHMVSELPLSFGDDFDAVFLHNIQTECERAKDALCLGSATAEVKIEEQGMEMRQLVEREWLVQMNLERLRSEIMRCLREARVSREAVDEVVLAGASSNIPEVRRVLLEFFQEHKLRYSIDPANLMSLSSQQYMNNISSTLNIPVAIFEGLNLGLHAL
ncbi:heat shock 70 kDa protein 3-like [Dendrobium catenatum]|uniref:heat shock 70 kDa protein 3-like n=1 Tax=Dendrobium catenatum TaxID=906689 RepID=UPI0010A0A631|nr:heat shock 70 kDa protein 3-like [Dendrobium catenatum]